MSIIERCASIGDIERMFGVSDIVEVSCKPKGFNTWCRLPYHNHSLGCPNFGLKRGCPPNVSYFLDKYEPLVRVAYLKFNFEEYLNLRRDAHPDWTERALRNPRHFQRHLDAGLRKNIEKQELSEGFVPVYTIEAMGVNVHRTRLNAGIVLEWPPKKTMYRIALLAKPLLS
jgi:predicted metal-binding protein